MCSVEFLSMSPSERQNRRISSRLASGSAAMIYCDRGKHNMSTVMIDMKAGSLAVLEGLIAGKRHRSTCLPSRKCNTSPLPALHRRRKHVSEDACTAFFQCPAE